MNTKPNILIISNMYPSAKNQTFGIFIKNQVEALKKRGYNIDIVAITDPRMSKPFLLKKYAKWMLQSISKLALRGKNVHIVHAHYVFPSGFIGLLFKRLYKTSLIVTSHGGDIDKMAKKGPFFFKWTQRILHESDHVIAVGEELKNEIITKFGVSEDKISIINMGVNRDIFKPMPKEKAKMELGIRPNRFPILFVGNMIKAKGLVELLKAYQELKSTHDQVELHLVGPIKELSFYQQLQEMVKKENIQDVTFHPPKGQEEIAQWMSAAEVFVLPSYIEGFGLVALEAMSCETPVVGSDVGGLSYLLDNGAGIKVQSKDPRSLKEGIEKVLLNKELRNQLVEQGKKKAEANDQEVLLNQLEEIYLGKRGE